VSDQSRRKLLKSIAAGSGAIVAGKSLPEIWSRPVVDSILLPAHALTSSISFAVSGVARNERNILEELLIPTAHAAMLKNICMDANGNSVSIQVTLDGVAALYTATFTLPFVLRALTSSAAGTPEVNISGALSADGNSVKGVINVGKTSSNYTAPKSTGSCQLSPGSGLKTYAIGDTGACGGIVFNITNGGLNGMEAAPADQGSAAWGCSTSASGATGTAIGDGVTNTTAILGACGTGTAADLASSYAGGSCTGGWFLPSKDELNEMFTQLHQNGLGAFSNAYYWSSSEVNSEGGADGAMSQHFGQGSQIEMSKGNIILLRAIRGF